MSEPNKEMAEGILEVGTNGKGEVEVVISRLDLMPDKNGVGHIVFSVERARHLAGLLLSESADALVERAHERKKAGDAQ